MGVAPKTIADKVYQCLACPGSSPVTSCADIPDTAPCTDGNACTKGDRCFGGVCTPGTSVTCMASDQCYNQGLCDPASGLCSNPPKDDGSPCEDGDACTTGDTCKSGLCTSGTPVVCNGGNSGTIAYCDSTQGCQRAVICWRPIDTGRQHARRSRARGQLCRPHRPWLLHGHLWLPK